MFGFCLFAPLGCHNLEIKAEGCCYKVVAMLYAIRQHQHGAFGPFALTWPFATLRYAFSAAARFIAAGWRRHVAEEALLLILLPQFCGGGCNFWSFGNLQIVVPPAWRHLASGSGARVLTHGKGAFDMSLGLDDLPRQRMKHQSLFPLISLVNNQEGRFAEKSEPRPDDLFASICLRRI